MLAGGIDIGTSGCKIALYDEKGTFCGSVYKEYHVKREKGLHEIDPEEIFAAVKAVLKEADTKDLKVLAVTSFGETFVVTDDKGDPLAPSMLYTDPRGGEECEIISGAFGAENLAFKTGTKLHPMYSLPKIMWIKNNMPHAFCQAKHIF